MSKKAADPPKAPGAKAQINDQIAVNRTLALPPASSFPALPAGFKATDPATRRKTLRFIADEQESELLDALREVAKVGSVQLCADLGEMPPAEEAATLADRIAEVSEGRAVLQSLLACYEELSMIAISDGVLYLDTIGHEYAHFAPKKPDLVNRYKKVAKFFEQQSARIVEGRARAKAEAEAIAKAKAEGT